MEMILKVSIVGLASFYCETQILMRLQYDSEAQSDWLVELSHMRSHVGLL